MKSGVVVVVVCSSHIDEQLLPFKNIGETTKKHTSAKVEHFESLLEIRLEKKKNNNAGEVFGRLCHMEKGSSPLPS